MKKLKIISHRGAAGLAPENSIESLRKASEFDVNGIEFDIWTTQDGKLVVHHDRILNLNGTKYDIPKTNSNDLSSLPTIKQALEAIGDKTPVIDLKDFSVTPTFIKLIQKLGARDFIVITHRKYLLDELLKYVPPDKLIAGSILRPIATIKLAGSKKIRGVGLHYLDLNPFTYWLARRKNLELHLFTINSRIYVKLLKALGLKVEIMTNFPNRFVR